MTKPVLQGDFFLNRGARLEPYARQKFGSTILFDQIKEHIMLRLFDRTRLLGPVIWRTIRT